MVVVMVVVVVVVVVAVVVVMVVVVVVMVVVEVVVAISVPSKREEKKCPRHNSGLHLCLKKYSLLKMYLHCHVNKKYTRLICFTVSLITIAN